MYRKDGLCADQERGSDELLETDVTVSLIGGGMQNLASHDFYDPSGKNGDTDRSPKVVRIFEHNFPSLYFAMREHRIKTSTGTEFVLGGDTLITYKLAIQKLWGTLYWRLPIDTQKSIQSTLHRYSWTDKKQILSFDGKEIVNNHQIGNMMPFPSGMPSMNMQRAQAGNYDYFDRFLHVVERYYAKGCSIEPVSELQKAICHQKGYFEFFGSYNNFIEYNLLQDFAGQDLWGITDFDEYVFRANSIIDQRGLRFTDPDTPVLKT